MLEAALADRIPGSCFVVEELQILLCIICEKMRNIRELCTPQGYSHLFHSLFFPPSSSLAGSFLLLHPTSGVFVSSGQPEESLLCCAIIYTPCVCSVFSRFDLYLKLMQIYLQLMQIYLHLMQIYPQFVNLTHLAAWSQSRFSAGWSQNSPCSTPLVSAELLQSRIWELILFIIPGFCIWAVPWSVC